MIACAGRPHYKAGNDYYKPEDFGSDDELHEVYNAKYHGAMPESIEKTGFDSGKKFLWAAAESDESPEDVADRLNRVSLERDLPHYYQDYVDGQAPQHPRDLGLDGEDRVLLVWEHGDFEGESGVSAPQPHVKGGGGGKQIFAYELPDNRRYRVARHEEHGRSPPASPSPSASSQSSGFHSDDD